MSVPVTFRVPDEDMMLVYKICRVAHCKARSPSDAVREAFVQLLRYAQMTEVVPLEVDPRDNDQQWVLSMEPEEGGSKLLTVATDMRRLTALDNPGRKLTKDELAERDVLYAKYYPDLKNED